MSIATKERQIIFSAPMVRAIIAGKKTQTRRIMKPQPDDDGLAKLIDGPWQDTSEKTYACPYGSPGDRLWVRESFTIESFGAGVAQIRYKADNVRGRTCGVSDRKLPNRLGGVPSIHMPRGCSRITLEVTDVRVERLRAITPWDCAAEGADPEVDHAVPKFMDLWESIHGTGSWKANPWVWAVTFARVDK